MMLVISNPVCISFLRGAAASNTEVVERAICRRLGITPRVYRAKAQGRPKVQGGAERIPVKITDARIVEFILCQKRTCGAPYRHTAESALMEVVQQRKNKGGAL